LKLSIITVNLNNCIGLEKTIVSVLNQNFKQFEFIVIDGNSNDSSKGLLDKYSDSIDYYSSEPDSGIYNAMNKGIHRAKGEFCLFINSGDILYNDQVLTDIFNQNLTADIITGNAYVREKGKNFQFVKAPEKISFYTFFQHTILHQATLIRTSIFDQIGYYTENLKIVADWEFFVKALFLHNFLHQTICITISVFDNTGISMQPKNFHISWQEREEVLKEYFPYFISDYKLLQPHSTFVFLQNIQKNTFLLHFFIIKSKIINKMFKIFKR